MSKVLVDFLGNIDVECDLTGDKTYDRFVGTWSVDGKDIGDFIVQSGWGRDWPKFSGGKYSAAEKDGSQLKAQLVETELQRRPLGVAQIRLTLADLIGALSAVLVVIIAAINVPSHRNQAPFPNRQHALRRLVEPVSIFASHLLRYPER